MASKRPWGEFITIWKEKNLNVKIIKVKPKARLSLQSHQHRDETWFLLDGDLHCQIGEEAIEMKKGNAYLIPKGCKHRLGSKEKGGRIVEIASGKFDEEDITRYEDDYNRAA